MRKTRTRRWSSSSSRARQRSRLRLRVRKREARRRSGLRARLRIRRGRLARLLQRKEALVVMRQRQRQLVVLLSLLRLRLVMRRDPPVQSRYRARLLTSWIKRVRRSGGPRRTRPSWKLLDRMGVVAVGAVGAVGVRGVAVGADVALAALPEGSPQPPVAVRALRRPAPVRRRRTSRSADVRSAE